MNLFNLQNFYFQERDYHCMNEANYIRRRTGTLINENRKRTHSPGLQRNPSDVDETFDSDGSTEEDESSITVKVRKFNS